MTARKSPVIRVRKRPSQARSQQLVTDILTAAACVLAKYGARRFTTSRVAETAGISVGSLYQYFPNKEAILFRLQSDEWHDTGQLMNRIFTDASLEPLARLERVVISFFQSECAEAQLRVALSDAAPLYRDAPEARERWNLGQQRTLQFLQEAFPSMLPHARVMAAEVLTLTMGAVGKRISEQGKTKTAVDALAREVCAMFRAYLDSLPHRAAVSGSSKVSGIKK